LQEVSGDTERLCPRSYQRNRCNQPKSPCLEPRSYRSTIVAPSTAKISSNPGREARFRSSRSGDEFSKTREEIGRISLSLGGEESFKVGRQRTVAFVLFIYLPVKPPSDFFIIFGKRHEVWF